MNTTSFEIKVRVEDKEKFLEWMKQHHGPIFRKLKKPIGYFRDKKECALYYSVKWEESILQTVVPVYLENRLVDLLDDATYGLNIDLKYLSHYQDPGTGESKGGYGYFNKQPFGSPWRV